MKNWNPILHENVIVMADGILNQLIDLETQLKYKYLKLTLTAFCDIKEQLKVDKRQ